MRTLIAIIFFFASSPAFARNVDGYTVAAGMMAAPSAQPLWEGGPNDVPPSSTLHCQSGEVPLVRGTTDRWIAGIASQPTSRQFGLDFARAAAIAPPGWDRTYYMAANTPIEQAAAVWCIPDPRYGRVMDAPAPPPPPAACNDKIDNDGDRLIDMDDPGCDSPTDDNEWNADPDINKRWAAYIDDVLREADNACPGTMVLYYDGRQPTKTGFDCGSTCSLHDVDPSRSGGQLYADTDWVSIIVADKAEWAATASLTWTDMTNVMGEGPSSRVDEVNSSLNDHKTIDGRGITFVEVIGDSPETTTMTVIYPDYTDLCEENLERDYLAQYQGVDLVVAGGGTLQSSVLGDGVSLTTHPWGTVAVEFGIEAGGPRAAFIGTIGWGGSFDDNCNMPSAWMPQVRLGATFNRAGAVGMMVDLRGQYTFAPSYVINPDDPDTTENEYSASSALGPNSLAILAEIGPRFAFGQSGVHNGWISPTFVAGPKVRWIEPTKGDQRVTLTGDIGLGLTTGWTW